MESQTTSSSIFECGEADATTKKNKIAQSFTASKPKMRSVKLYKKADTGSPSGTVTVSLQADSSGDPDGTPLATVTFTNALWLALQDDAEFEAIFGTEYDSLVIGDTYWIVIESSTSDNSNHINLGGDGTTGDGSVEYNNGTDGWVSIASSALYYKTIEGANNQIPITKDGGHIANELSNIVVREYDVNATWTKKAELVKVKIEAWGAGGGGGWGRSNYIGGGGGGGAYVTKIIPVASLGTTENITIGTGGAGASSGGDDDAGASGGDTTFGSLLTAYGGGGGNGGDDTANQSGGGGGGGGTTSAGTSSTGVAGGAGGTGYISTFDKGGDGAQGGDGNTSVYGGAGGAGAKGGGGTDCDGGASYYGGGGGGAGNSDSYPTVGGSSALGGDGGAGGTESDIDGEAGVVPAGGGGGGSNSNIFTGLGTQGAGGDGANGKIIVTEYYE